MLDPKKLLDDLMQARVPGTGSTVAEKAEPDVVGMSWDQPRDDSREGGATSPAVSSEGANPS